MVLVWLGGVFAYTLTVFCGGLVRLGGPDFDWGSAVPCCSCESLCLGFTYGDHFSLHMIRLGFYTPEMIAGVDRIKPLDCGFSLCPLFLARGWSGFIPVFQLAKLLVDESLLSRRAMDMEMVGQPAIHTYQSSQVLVPASQPSTYSHLLT